jgi:hypothetical protein
VSASNLLGLASSLIILITLFEMLRRHRLREKFAVIWFVIAVCALVVALVPSLLTWATDVLGLSLPSNLLFFVASVVLLMLSLQHSYELGRLEERTRTLAEEVALLRLDVEGARRDGATGDKATGPPDAR